VKSLLRASHYRQPQSSCDHSIRGFENAKYEERSEKKGAGEIESNKIESFSSPKSTTILQLDEVQRQELIVSQCVSCGTSGYSLLLSINIGISVARFLDHGT
jgi:hypothetical protein